MLVLSVLKAGNYIPNCSNHQNYLSIFTIYFDVLSSEVSPLDIFFEDFLGALSEASLEFLASLKPLSSCSFALSALVFCTFGRLLEAALVFLFFLLFSDLGV